MIIMVSKQYMIIVYTCCWVAGSISIAVGAAASPTLAANIQDDKLAWQQVANQCANFDQSIGTLASYQEFQANFDKLNKCLHLSDPPKGCLEAEQQCNQNGLSYSASKVLGSLIERASSDEPMCNMEFAMRIYRLHKQLAPSGASPIPKIALPLRALANRWASHCRKSLFKRLQNIDKRAPDVSKHVYLMANLLNSGTKVAELPLEPEHYVPVLGDERVLDEKVSSASGCGFTFNTSKQIDMAIQMLQISCNTLKQYHVNLFGSLGLLASVGYAASGLNSPPALDLQPEKERALVRAWIVSAMICQTMRGVNRMSSVDSEGESRTEILILPLKGADVSLKEEQDKSFASFGLPEAVEGRIGLELGNSFDDGDHIIYRDYLRLHARKMELINGPSRQLANAIYTYLDLRQNNRKPMVTTILNLS